MFFNRPILDPKTMAELDELEAKYKVESSEYEWENKYVHIFTVLRRHLKKRLDVFDKQDREWAQHKERIRAELRKKDKGKKIGRAIYK